MSPQRQAACTFVCSWLARVLMFAFIVAFCGGCDILREEYYQRTGKSEGTLVANIGMSLEEVQKRSTLKLEETFHYPSGESLKAGQAVFDLDVAGTGLRLERCRFYWLHTLKNDSRLDHIAIYVTPPTLSRAELDAAEQALRQKLRDTGWLPGRFVYHTPEDKALHNGDADGYGTYWLRNDVLFILESKRMDDEKPGDDPKTAGKFLQSVKLMTFNFTEHAHLEFPGQQLPPPSKQTKR
jgi:hypothetical protein